MSTGARVAGALRASPRMRSVIAHVLRSPDGTAATVTGWVKALRSQKKLSFVDVGDGSCPERLQVVIESSRRPPDLGWGSAVRVSGRVATAANGRKEMHAESATVVGACPVEGFPFVARQTHSPERERGHLHLRFRTDRAASVARVRHAAATEIRDYFDSLDYVSVDAPVITSNDCEGAGETFRVKFETKKETEPYFGRETFLTVSGQLHLEAAVRGLSRAYRFGPVFRAENSKSRLHLSEFFMVEAESAFVDDVDEVTELAEDLLRRVTERVTERREADLKFLRGDDEFRPPDRPFVRMTYDEAIESLSRRSHLFETPPKRELGLSKEHELYLTKFTEGIPVFVLEWPRELKPFYMKGLPGNDEKVSAFDLLIPVTGEVVGGSLREDDYDALKRRSPSPDLEWYLDLRKYGNAPTGGFGLGFERYLQWLCNVANIKDTIPFPRWPHNCSM